jgi:acyl transferase domain-containing protein
VYVGLSQLNMLSPDGRCKAWDVSANGYVRSEGCGLVLLKPLKRALADNDRIYGIIRGTAANSDGRSSVPITSPNQASHERMLRAAYECARIDPALVQYVEAHGTGTLRGDPVETGALGNVMGKGSNRSDNLIIGSVKTNIGHLESAAGVAGLLKACLVLTNRKIPQNLHFNTPNPNIPFNEWRLHVPTTLEDLPTPKQNHPHYVGVNSFGYGGTNAHIVLEEAPAPKISEGESSLPHHLLTLSAHNKPTLDALAKRFVDFLQNKSSTQLRNICYTASVRRTHHSHRLAVVGEDAQALCTKLDGFLANSTKSNFAYSKAEIQVPPPVVFIFSGQGPQWWGMGRGLLSHPVFFEALTSVDGLLFKHTGWSVMEKLSQAKDDAAILEDTSVSQPAMFALQVGLITLYNHWGIKPSAIIGHSIGEIAAAWASGAITLSQGVAIVYHRSSLQKRLSNSGKMLAVGMSYEECVSFLGGTSPQKACKAS